MRYETGYRRRIGRSGDGRGAGERLLFFLGMIAVGVVLALTVGGRGEGRREPEPEVVAVMSTAAEQPEDSPTAADGEEGGSVYDGIGAFFARLLTGRGG